MVRGLVHGVLAAGGGVTTLVSADPRAEPNDPDSAFTFIWTVLTAVDTYVAGFAPLALRRVVARVVLSPKTLAERLPDHHRATWERLVRAGCLELHYVDDAAYFGGSFRPVQARHGDALVIVSGGKGVVHLSSLFRSPDKPVIPIDVDAGSSLMDGPGGAAIYREALVYPERFVSVGVEHLRRALPTLSLQRDDAAPAVVAEQVRDLLIRLGASAAGAPRALVMPGAQPPPVSLAVTLQTDGPVAWARFIDEARSLLPGASLEPGALPTFARFRLGSFSRDAVIRAAEARVFDDFARVAGGRAVQEITADGECLYELLPSTAFEHPVQTDVEEARLKKALRDVKVLLITTTATEREALLARLAPPARTRTILRGALGELTVRVGRLGRYDVANVECAMGSLDRRGSALTVLDAVTKLDPRAIVAVGIAFGVDRRKQRFGDVLVADPIAPYELAKVASDATVRRATQLRAGPTLVERFTTHHDDWRLDRHTGPARVHAGLVLSGEKVVDAQHFRDALRADYPTAIGGEMEGTGVYAAASYRGVEVLLVKAICDFADGHKNDRAQPFAARAAVALVEHVFSKPDVLRHIGVRTASPRAASAR
jgi:nucleoside phosphorylase